MRLYCSRFLYETNMGDFESINNVNFRKLQTRYYEATFIIEIGRE